MRFGQWITNKNVTPVSHIKPWLRKEDGSLAPWGYFAFDRRGTDLDDEGGLVSFRKRFTMGKAKSVTLRITALGVFEAYINGVRIGSEEMKPGWTDYRYHVFEFEYDVTDLCRTGDNVLIITVSNGWWSGRISGGIYGWRKCGVCAEIEKVFEDNHHELIATDESWETVQGGRVRSADIWNGEFYDGREDDVVTEHEKFPWVHADEYEGITCEILSHIGEPVRLYDCTQPQSAVVYHGTEENGTDFGTIKVISRRVGLHCERGTLGAGESLVLDMGANRTARPHLHFAADRGVTIRVYCAEMLNDSGSLARGNDGPCGSAYIDNYRSALSRVQIITGGGEETFSPLYTFYGYRYLEIVADGDVEILDVESHVIGSDIRTTGHIETSNEEVNRLFDNVVRGLRSNYLSIPTDCPQRDERWGWTGDTQMFCSAAAYLADVDKFLNKWMMDLCDSQDETGAYSFVAPRVFQSPARADGASAWSDSGIIVPYKMWLMYGDTDILRNNFDSMERYMTFIKNDRGLDGPRPIYGDWLCYEETPKAYVSVCYYAYDALLMAKISRILGKDDRAAYYEALRGEIIAHYLEQYTTDGEINVKTQTGYLLPLTFEMVDGELREKTIAALKKKIVDNDYTLSMGFVGTGYLNITLSAVGLNNEAYSLLLQTKDPSWLYSVRQGATTIWERWNSYNLDRGFGQVTMNSFNHYAYGAVAEWMFGYMAGIRPVESTPGFSRFILAPKPDTRPDAELPEGQERITYVKASYDSAAGMIRASWAYENGVFTYRVTIPEGAVARVEFPIAEDATEILINDIVFKEGDGAEKVGNLMIFELSAGDYTIR